MILPVYLYDRLFYCLEKVITNENVNMGNIQFLDPEKKVLVIAVHKGFRQDFLDYFEEVKPFDTSACGRAVGIGNTVIIPDVNIDQAFAAHRKIANEAGFRSVRSVPILAANNELLGVLSTHSAAPNWNWKPLETKNLYELENILSSMVGHSHS